MNVLTTATAAIAFALTATGAIGAAVVLFALAMLLVFATPYTESV